MEMDPSTGHLNSCLTTPEGDPINSTKKSCIGITETGDRCSTQLCEVGCLRKNARGVIFGYCWYHWIVHCQEKEWDPDLSYCANLVCDQKDLSLEQRYEIVPDNIKEILGFPEENKHFSKERIRQVKMLEKAQRGDHDRIMAKHQCAAEDLRIRIHHLTNQIEGAYDESFSSGESYDESFSSEEESYEEDGGSSSDEVFSISDQEELSSEEEDGIVIDLTGSVELKRLKRKSELIEARPNKKPRL